tara:strand:+ start:2858 stop:3313 length:456 start_codon:yes stop_codon:yes gene_type:complete
MKLSYNDVKGSPLGAVASAAIRSHMEASPEGVESVKVNDLDLKILINDVEIPMVRFTEILNADMELSSAREVLRGLRAELSTLQDYISGSDPRSVYRQVADSFWDAMSNVQLDLSDYVSPNVSEDDYYDSGQSNALDSIENIAHRLDKIRL